jgi:hypothetical protein
MWADMQKLMIAPTLSVETLAARSCVGDFMERRRAYQRWHYQQNIDDERERDRERARARRARAHHAP